MSRTRYRFGEAGYPYFLTCTVVGWLPVFTRTEATDILFNSWKYLQKEQGLRLFAFVILENHLHFIASAPDLSGAIRNFKSFTAKKLLELLEHRQALELLREFAFRKAKHKNDSQFQFWQEGSHPQQITSDDMMWQKMEYIHNNPLKRGYVDLPEHWRYSSARNYAGLPGLIDVVKDWM